MISQLEIGREKGMRNIKQKLNQSWPMISVSENRVENTVNLKGSECLTVFCK